MLSWRVLLATLALLLFLIAAYLTPPTDVPGKLTRAAFAALVIAWLLP